MILSAQSIRLRCLHTSRPMVSPFEERTRFEGVTFGLGPAGYDVRLAQDIELMSRGFALGSTIERFDVPTNVLFSIKDKSTWARRGLSVFNSTGEPGWRGFLTIELVNHGAETICLRAGMGIAHVVFERLDQPTDLPYEGKYQDQKEGPQAAIAEPARRTADADHTGWAG